ncbi:ras-related Rab-37-like [Brachionus plicatilis]|uniref:Ras-related Rab-37-like n=1 Tax=Brachionus plicatilis TaxID=10195 RepID=A0A3M7T5K9_BRAPC|nr:ras-related Rab-37-like [Brachionus plicatilis]
MSEKEASFEVSNSIAQNFANSASVGSPTSKQMPSSTSVEAQVSHYNEETIHKTILVGDSGVGKTSVLVQFDQGKFQSGSFSATVGIGFTSLENI